MHRKGDDADTASWLTFDLRTPVEMHHTLNSRHLDTWKWTAVLNSLLAGRDITFTAADAGSDDLTFIWEWGNGSPSTAKTYFNEGTAPDPCPSLGGTFPLTATDSQVHQYSSAGRYDLKLTARDDDGGMTKILNIVVIP